MSGALGEGLPPLRTIHLDEHLAAVEKPAGMLVIPGRGAPEPTVREVAAVQLGGPVWVVHRLDRGTSGLLLLARSAAAHRALNLAFDRREVEKRYLALVRVGDPAALAERRIDLPIAPGRKGRMRATTPEDPRGKPAATAIRPLERRGPLALVEARPETGRTHQIRVHLAAIGLPLAVDPDYGSGDPLRDAAGRVVLARTPLHAAGLRLAHPMGGAPLALESPLPPDIAAALGPAPTPGAR